jgi:exopolyphosphatase/guanosine-5'-triphosphate,3'-diphosphate pyrophosphatase
MNDRYISVKKTAAQYDHDFAHARQVSSLAVSLFQVTHDLHSLGTVEEELLVCAALLHDIGWCDGQAKHHKRSYQLILADPPVGLSHRETVLIANIARYHKGALPKPSHEGFAALPAADKEIVLKLSALLRITDGLDATHGNLCTVTGCAISADAATVEVCANQDISIEIGSAEEKSDLFAQVFGRKVVFNFTHRGI